MQRSVKARLEALERLEAMEDEGPWPNPARLPDVEVVGTIYDDIGAGRWGRYWRGPGRLDMPDLGGMSVLYMAYRRGLVERFNAVLDGRVFYALTPDDIAEARSAIAAGDITIRMGWRGGTPPTYEACGLSWSAPGPLGGLACQVQHAYAAVCEQRGAAVVWTMDAIHEFLREADAQEL